MRGSDRTNTYNSKKKYAIKQRKTVFFQSEDVLRYKKKHSVTKSNQAT